MLHIKFLDHRTRGSREEDFYRFFTIYGHGSHLCHVTNIILIKKIVVPLSEKVPHKIWL